MWEQVKENRLSLSVPEDYLQFSGIWVHPRLFGGSVLLIALVFCVVLFCVFTIWIPCCDVRYDFRVKTMFGLVLHALLYFIRDMPFRDIKNIYSIRLESHLNLYRFIYYLCYLYLFIDTYCQTRFPYQMMFVSFNTNTTGVTCVLIPFKFCTTANHIAFTYGDILQINDTCYDIELDNSEM
jgi:hypothetical protein